jgi:polar amino acid transport system substrate-binding protein
MGNFRTLIMKTILALLAICASATAWSSEPIDVVVFSDEAYPPYSYAENGEARGIYAEIFRKAFAQMPEYRVQIKPMPWKRGLKMLESGDGFALFPPYFRPQERPFMKYSTPILPESVAVFCSEAIAARVERKRWPEDYFGLRFGLNTGFSLGGEKFSQAVKDGHIILDQANGNRINLEKLILQRIDCYMNDRFSILWEWRHMNAEGLNHDGVKIIDTGIVGVEQGYLGYTDRDNGRFPYKEDFIIQLNKIIENMRRTGEISRIVDRILEQ